MVQFSALLQSVLDHHVGVRTVLSHIALCHHDNVFSEAEAPQATIDFLRGPAPVSTFRHDYQHIEIAIGAHLSTSCRAKEDNTPGMDCLDNAPDQLVNGLRIGSATQVMLDGMYCLRKALNIKAVFV